MSFHLKVFKVSTRSIYITLLVYITHYSSITQTNTHKFPVHTTTCCLDLTALSLYFVFTRFVVCTFQCCLWVSVVLLCTYCVLVVWKMCLRLLFLFVGVLSSVLCLAGNRHVQEGGLLAYENIHFQVKEMSFGGTWFSTAIWRMIDLFLHMQIVSCTLIKIHRIWENTFQGDIHSSQCLKCWWQSARLILGNYT